VAVATPLGTKGCLGHPIETTPNGGLGDLEALWPFSASEEAVFLGSKTGFMLGKTPPLAIVTPWSSLASSSPSNSTCPGLIMFFLLSRAAFLANSSTYISLYTTTQISRSSPFSIFCRPIRKAIWMPRNSRKKVDINLGYNIFIFA
jgi:hypothetical protein